MGDVDRLGYREVMVIGVHEVGQEFIHPEKICLQLKDTSVRKAPIDVGSLAFSNRSRVSDHKHGRGNMVSERSLVPQRRKLILNILDSLTGLRDSSIRYYLILTEKVVTWLTDNGYVEIFSSSKSAATAYVSYVDFLVESIMHERIKQQYANALQRAFQAIVRLQWPEEYQYILNAAQAIPVSRDGIRPPKDREVQKFKSVCLAVAQTFGRFVQHNEQYPCVVIIDDYEVVKFPSNDGVFSPYVSGSPCFNAVERRIATFEEYRSSESVVKRGSQLGTDRSTLQNSLESFEMSNSNPRCHDRIKMAFLALKAYAALLTLVTGASPTELAQFDYDEALEVENSVLRKEFKSIKFRASGKKTSYVIGRKEGLPLLREYLRLRQWVLNGRACKWLFFAVPRASQLDSVVEFKPMNAGQGLKRFYESIAGAYLDPTCPNITSGKVRKYKSKVHHAHGIPPEVISLSLNHTQAVNLSSYAESDLEQQGIELGTYWKAMRKAADTIKDRRLSESGLSSVASGHCNGFNKPTANFVVPEAAVSPNCRQQLGCLYCVNYVCHADEEDVHKLLSLLYVIDSVRNASSDFYHAESLYADVALRINILLASISKQSGKTLRLIESLKTKVYTNGVLTPFWEARLQRYEELGVIFK